MGMSPGTPPWMKMGYTPCEDSVNVRGRRLFSVESLRRNMTWGCL
jgi:hypothetical protein